MQKKKNTIFIYFSIRSKKKKMCKTANCMPTKNYNHVQNLNVRCKNRKEIP